MAYVVAEKNRVLGRLIAHELSGEELELVTGGEYYENSLAAGTSSTTTANGCPNGDADVD